ncbi:MAG TPA: hypothetical protein ENG42_00085 [Candidatus Aenigmarchaeota archaeon]|nr:MAG: hypothetical protein DRP03_00480 [Candidatus Aenigmarchaeota archaeon]HDD45850.1 hypothetical protein [Candidatus Aenigmarchaeota archaeon]
MLSLYKRLSVELFGWVYERHKEYFKNLELHLKNANIKMLAKTWVSLSVLTSIVTGIVCAVIVAAICIIFNVSNIIQLILFSTFPFLFALIAFTLFYVYPVQKESSIRKSIENNMPFAIIHMAAVASSGIPPEFMFELITGFEYGKISDQVRLIIRNMRSFNMSSVDAIRDVAMRTPSKEFREFLMGIVSNIESGGNLTEYIRGAAEKALFDYKIKREKYLKTLSTYADVYTALLVAAPLMMLSLLATMSIIGGNIMGMTINDLILIITWVFLPVFNIIFLAFVHVTYPGG